MTERPVDVPPSGDEPLTVIQRAFVRAVAQAIVKKLRATCGEDVELAEPTGPRLVARPGDRS
jgi:hypothetical protein